MSWMIYFSFYLLFGGFVASILLLELYFLLDLFAAGRGMVLLQTNESEGRHCQPFLLDMCNKEGEVVGFTPIKNYQFWFCQKVIKWKKGIFAGIRGEQGGKGERWIVMHFGVCKAYLFLKPHFYFGINIGFVIAEEEFGKNFLYRGIKFIVQTQIWNIWLIYEFFVPGGR